MLDNQNALPSRRVEVITELSALEVLRPLWLDLISKTPSAMGFNAPGAVLSWYRHVERHSTPYAVAVWRGAELVGLATLSATHLGPFRLYCSAGAGYGFYGGPLLGPDPEPVSRILHGHIAELVRGGRAAVYLRRLQADHPLLDSLEQGPDITCTTMGSAEANSVVDFGRMPDPERYFAQVGRKHAVPRRKRRLSEHVESLETQPDDSDPDAALDSMRDMLLRRFGEDLRMFRGPHNQTLTRELVRSLTAEGHAQVASIVADSRRIAVTVDLHAGLRTYWYAVAYDPDFQDFSLGHIELYDYLRRAHASGVSAVDLGSSGFAYKRRWANAESHFRTIAVTAPGLAGAVANHLRQATITLHRRHVQARDTGLPIL